MERDHLTAEDRRELSDSRPRNKVVRKGYQSRGVSPKVDRSDRNTPYYRSLEQLAKSANEWMIWKKNLTLEKSYRALRTLTERNQLLPASLRKSLTTGTLRQDAMDSPKSNAKCKLESLLLSNSNSVEVFRAIANSKSGKELFKRYWDRTVKVTTSTYFTDAGKVIRKTDIPLSLNNSQVSGRQGPCKPVTGKRMKRQMKFSSSSSSDKLLVPGLKRT